MKKIIKKYIIVLCAFMLIGVGFIGTVLYENYLRKDKIVIGARNYTEQQVIAEMLCLLLEEKTSLKVERKYQLDGAFIAFEALRSDSIDLILEYTGTFLADIMREKPTSDSEKDLQLVYKFSRKHGLRWIIPLGFGNEYVFLVHKDSPLSTISELSEEVKKHPQFRVGLEIEYAARPEHEFIVQGYHFSPKIVQLVENTFSYMNVQNKDVDAAIGFKTEGRIQKYDLKVLKDDKHIYPSYMAAIVARNKLLKQHPEIEEALRPLEGRLSEETIRRLNYEVDALEKTPSDVAREFLQQEGLIATAKHP